MEKRPNNQKRINLSSQSGVSLPEILIVFIIIAIVVLMALPQMISSRRLFMFSAVQREMTTYLRETRQMAMSERKVITFQYDDANKRIVVFGGTLGLAGDPKNRRLELSGMGVDPADIVYGRPAGVSTAALADGSNISNLTSGVVEIAFQADGSVVDGSDNPVNNALFLYHAMYPAETAYAISILGAGGRVKVWNYSPGVNVYVE
jgi:Tfp pilus assembly protein FimT